MGAQPVNGKLLPTFLILICLVPAGAGSYRMAKIIMRGQFALDFAADHVDQLPLLLHALGAIGFLVMGALQILPGTRARHPLYHRRAGRLAASLGLLGALAGLWMTVLHPDISTRLLYWGRLASGTFWALAIGMAVWAVLRRNIPAHGAWMIRAYAIAAPAGTLPFILLPLVLIVGEEGHTLFFDAVQVVAWPVHLAVAEWLIRRRQRRRPSSVRPILSLSEKGT